MIFKLFLWNKFEITTKSWSTTAEKEREKSDAGNRKMIANNLEQFG